MLSAALIQYFESVGTSHYFNASIQKVLKFGALAYRIISMCQSNQFKCVTKHSTFYALFEYACRTPKQMLLIRFV